MLTFLLCFSFFLLFDLVLGESENKRNKFSILKKAFGFRDEADRNVKHRKKTLEFS